MKISPQLEQQILSTPGVVVRRAGFCADPALPDDKGVHTVHFVTAGVAVMANTQTGELESLVAMVPVKTVSETNVRQRGMWRAKSRRGNEAWRAVSRTFGPHLTLLAPFAAAYHANKAIEVKFVRLGGIHLDRMANLGPAMKSVEDALAFLMGADDRDPRWRATADQEPGGAVGVRVEIRVFTV